MKKVILLLLVISLVLAFASCKKDEPQNNDPGKGFGADLDIENINPEDDNLNFTLEGLDKWHVFSVEKDGIPERTYYSPNDANGNTTNATITVTAIPVGDGGFDKFVEDFYNTIKKTSSDFKIITELSASKLGSFDAMHFAYSFTQMGAQKMVMEQTLMQTSDGRIYLFTCTCLASSYENYKDIFATSRESFKFN